MSEPARPIRLAIVRLAYNPFGGAERFVERALHALGEGAVKVSLLTRKWEGAAPANVEVIQCPKRGFERLSRYRHFVRWVQQTAREQGFDLVQSHERIPGCDIFRAGDGVHATWLEQRARVLGSLGRLAQRLSLWHRYITSLEAEMFRDARLRAVICNSEMVRRDIAQRFPEAASKLHVIHNGVDLNKFHPGLREQHRAHIRLQLGGTDALPIILYIGSGFERKGVPQLLQALAKPALAHAQLWIIGKDRKAKDYARLAEQLEVAPRVHFLGPQQDVTPYLGAADVFALPSLYDPMPNAALEAFAAGLPVLSSSSTGAAELIEAGRNGEVVDALDIDGIATTLASLLRTSLDPVRGPAMREAARTCVAGMGTDSMAGALVALYRDLMETRPTL